jgi:hypothetical protein
VLKLCHGVVIADLSDYLSMFGLEVLDILSIKESNPHEFTSFAQILDGEIRY